MEAVTPSCTPTCGSIGHQYAMLMAWRCEHHGAVTVSIRRWEDTPDGTRTFLDSTTAFGPFDRAEDASGYLREIAAALVDLLSGP